MLQALIFSSLLMPVYWSAPKAGLACRPTVTESLLKVLPKVRLSGCAPAIVAGKHVFACFYYTGRSPEAAGECRAIVYSTDKCKTWTAACTCANFDHKECAVSQAVKQKTGEESL
jgi:hypothetical protein